MNANHHSRLIEETRAAFEADAKQYGFDLTRYHCAAPEPWSQYANEATGHRWSGWLAAIAEMEAPYNSSENDTQPRRCKRCTGVWGGGATAEGT